MIKKAISMFSFQPDDLFQNLSENDKKDLLSFCSVVFSNKLFERLFDEIYTKQIMETVMNIDNNDLSKENKGKLLGIAGVKDIFQQYHLQYLDLIKKEEDFDKNEVI
jgi:hypothetical protein